MGPQSAASRDEPVLDTLGRPLRSLRLSVTDRCNLRCSYCMPEATYQWLPRAELLSFDELSSLVDRFCELGVDRLRITGGEPLLRRDLPVLIAALSDKRALRDIALTSNGLGLAELAAPLAAAGLSRLTVSLDTLRPDRFEALSRKDALGQVLDGIDAARAAGLDRDLKIDAVVIGGVNDDELSALLAYGRQVRGEVRFIEYMDVGGATGWSRDQVVSREQMLARIEREHGPATPLDGRGAAPAERFRLADGSVFGIVASTTTPFCRACDRSRITADGTWYHCLYAQRGIDLKGPLRAGTAPEALRELIRSRWTEREARGAEERAATPGRGAFVSVEALRADPRLEMHKRGG